MALDGTEKNEYKSQNTLISINQSAQKMLDAMNDIVWSIQPQNDTLENIFVRMISFASDIFDAKNIKLQWTVNDSIPFLQFRES